jgi:hypothetical protein
VANSNSREYDQYRLFPGSLGKRLVEIWGDDPKVYKARAIQTLDDATLILKRFHAQSLGEAFGIMAGMGGGASPLDGIRAEEQLELPELSSTDIDLFGSF